jgi:hypothetical protein
VRGERREDGRGERGDRGNLASLALLRGGGLLRPVRDEGGSKGGSERASGRDRTGGRRRTALKSHRSRT